MAIYLKRYGVVFLVVCFGLIMSYALYTAFSYFERQEQAHQYESTFEGKVNNLTQAIMAIDKVFQAASSVLVTSPSQTNEDFSQLINKQFLEHTGIKGIEWARAVNSNNVEALESNMRSQGFFDFRVYTPETAKCSPQTLGYTLPVVLAQPMERVGQNLGVTLESNCVLSDAIASGMGSDYFVDTSYLDGEHTVQLFQPLFDAKARLLGVLHGQVMMNELMDEIWRDVALSEGLQLAIYRDAEHKDLLYDSNWLRECGSDCTRTKATYKLNAMLPMANELWYVELSIIEHSSRLNSFIIAGLMVILTLCLSVYIFSSINRVQWANNLVEERTQTLAFRASHDELTGLLNRQALKNVLAMSMGTAEDQSLSCFSLLFIDLDHFKKVNDTMGHLVGDRLLQQVATRLLSSARADDLVFRFGGDEFVLILRNSCDEALVENVAERVLEQLQQPFLIDDNPYLIGASIGATLVSDMSINSDEVMRNADIAMYEAKNAGRGKVIFFSANMYQQVLYRQELEAALHNAVNESQLSLHFQAIVDSKEQIKGFEALCRWHHPQHGLIKPDDFIAIAEESGFIVKLGTWVIEQACRQLAHWRSLWGIEHLPYISVNVSPAQLKDNTIVDNISSCLAKYNIPGRYLAIELTESALIHNKACVKQHLKSVRQLGVRVFLDDFGTGYSSLSLLQHFPIDVLKVDRSFVAGLAQGNHESASLIAVIINMAHALNMEIVAEGVEDEKTCHWLVSKSCEGMQGYYFSKPLCGKSLAALMSKSVRLKLQSDNISGQVFI
mgnify:CR=1 FL=1